MDAIVRAKYQKCPKCARWINLDGDIGWIDVHGKQHAHEGIRLEERDGAVVGVQVMDPWTLTAQTSIKKRRRSTGVGKRNK